MGSPVRCPPGPGSISSAKRTPRYLPSPSPPASTILGDIADAVDRAQAQTFAQFQADLEPLLRKRGWWGEQTVVGPLQQGRRCGDEAAVRQVPGPALEDWISGVIRCIAPASAADPLALPVRVEVHAESLQLLMPVTLLATLRSRLVPGETAEPDAADPALRLIFPVRMRLHQLSAHFKSLKSVLLSRVRLNQYRPRRDTGLVLPSIQLRHVRTAWGRFQDACCEAREEGARCAPGRPARDLRARWWGDPLGPIEVGLVYPTTISSRAQVANPRGPGAT